VFVLGWTTFVFAGLYPSLLAVPLVVLALLTLVYRPWQHGRPSMPALDLWLWITLAAIGAQLVPLPKELIDLVSPAARPASEQLHLVVPDALPVSIDTTRTVNALAATAAGILVFLIARRVFESGGVRIVARGVALLGMLLATIALAQDATAGGLMYWRWKSLDEGPDPFGPFVNRNHFATWAVLAIPICVGYLAAHAAAHTHRSRENIPLRRRLATFFDGRAMALTAAAGLLCVALVMTLSRSGLFGLAAASVTGLVLRLRHEARLRSLDAEGELRRGKPGVRSLDAEGELRRGKPGVRSLDAEGELRRGEPGVRSLDGQDELSRGRRSRGSATWWLAGGAAVALALTLAELSPAAFAARLSTFRVSAGGRFAIWHDTLPILRDFWLTGTGAGTYLTSMLVYQRSSPGWLFNQAHNHYLQVAAEGGLLVGVPVLIALLCLAREAWASVAGDKSGMYWIRAGALCGLAGVAAQSVWETGLTMPANAALAALAAAIVVHDLTPHARH
jgi:O-Antigen ligase